MVGGKVLAVVECRVGGRQEGRSRAPLVTVALWVATSSQALLSPHDTVTGLRGRWMGLPLSLFNSCFTPCPVPVVLFSSSTLTNLSLTSYISLCIMSSYNLYLWVFLNLSPMLSHPQPPSDLEWRFVNFAVV